MPSSSRTTSRGSSHKPMARTLGIDFGTNSIGWAVVHDGKLVRVGARIFPAGPVTRPRWTWPAFSPEQVARFSLLVLALGAGVLAVFYAPQFWGSVAFSALIGCLSLFKH